MDLFEDLPEPGPGSGSTATANENRSTPYKPAAPVTNRSLSTSLYDDLPTQSVTKATEHPVTIETGKRKLQDASNGDRTEKKQKSGVYDIDSYIVERQGEREDMQDAHIIIKDFTAHIPDLHPSIYRMSLYGVFDGHAGVRASR